MAATRRKFLFSSTATLAAGMIACRRSNALPSGEAQESDPKVDPLKILILGGTGFIGPALVEAALARGHAVTLFNRGKTNPELFPTVEKLRGDRDPNKGEGLKALEGRKFDVVFDDCGYLPRVVKASAELLSPNIGQYIFVSSISAYKDNSKEGANEDAELSTMPDPTVETMGQNFEFYGPLKVLCEQAAEAACPKRTTIVRPGYIVGPGDNTDRFTWWPLRVERGGELLAPGQPDDPIQIIDVRDLGEWMVRLAERRTIGTFNACGPAQKLTMQRVLDVSKELTKSDAKFMWVPLDALRGEGIDLENTWPIWAPYDGTSRGFHTWSNARAIAAGLRFRTVEDTIRSTLDWFKTQSDERQAKHLKAGPSAVQEAEWLEKLRSHAKKSGGS